MEHSGKRSRDEFEADQFAQQPYDDESKRQHIDPAQELINNVCKDIRRLGENPNIVNQVDDVSYISNPIVAEFEKIDKLRNSILSTIYAVVIEQPQKINAVSNLILICNAKNFVVAKYVIEYLHAKAQKMLDSIGDDKEADTQSKLPEEDAGVFNNIKSILKLFATLSPIIENHSVVNLFRQFLTLAIDLQNETPETRNGLAEGIFYNVLISIPYLFSNISPASSEELVSKVNELVELAKDFKIVEISHVLLQPFDSKSNNYELPYEPKKIIDLILPVIIALQGEDKSWNPFLNEDSSSKLFLNFNELVQPIVDEALKFNTVSNEVVKHQVPQLSLPEISKLKTYIPTGSIDKLWYSNPRVLFQVYNSTEYETVPQIDTYIGLFFKDLSFDILTNLSFNKTEASIQLSILDLYFNKNLFAPPGSSIDQLKSIHADNESGVNQPPLSTWKVEDIAVESILTMIFQLPITLHHEIYYYTVLIACCRESPESIAPVFGRAIRYFYNNLETLDYELKIRFLDWMTTQISNFEFSWKWDEWVNDSKKFKNLKYHPKRSFIKNLIAKEIRLSNKNRIKDSFVTLNPETSEVVTIDEFHQYLNISLFENESKYIIDYDTELYGDDSQVKELLAKLYFEKKNALAEKSIVGAQEEIFFNYSNPELPLHQISSKVYDFVSAHWKTNSEFSDLYKEILTGVQTLPNINAERFIINLFFQTYAYIGSRSIYSVVSVLSRDINKLKYLSGSEITYGDDEAKFESLELTPEQVENRQVWIIEAIFRIWSHQPQVVFLVLEYLIEFEILKPEFLIPKTLSLSTNLLIENVSCMESINRILNNFHTSNPEQFKKLFLIVVNSIVRNLNLISQSLNVPNNETITIQKEFDEEDLDLQKNINNQWLYYEYKGLLKSYIRKYLKSDADYFEGVKEELQSIENELVLLDVLSWLN
ncbi:GCR3 protein [Suhomyces tanzawaensis NRRL Y-17324]|uniref:Nuclear cap-binding protein complex subunit 1 n=1 Tax=Suhomyces tanzawaensis NRRL Y-17324 TaxID=984487 RepID=A0A1E4SN74_9ASCO|nr:GCR3 protein [Suhomyces tanzawaensis NRRL Y-17324]ODV80963.1 GCR3 protein [Suhomyces tanzawaensis NRRL Y-17324]